MAEKFRLFPTLKRKTASNENKPRQIADGACFSFCCPTSGRTLEMGFHPLFSLNCKRRSGALVRSLAPHQAKPGLVSGGASSVMEPPANRVSPAGIKDCVSRDFPAPRNPVSTGSIANFARRKSHRRIALWAPWEVAADVAIFSLGIKTLRLNCRCVNTKPSSKYFVKLRCKRPGITAFAARFPFPPKALSNRRCAPRPIWI